MISVGVFTLRETTYPGEAVIGEMYRSGKSRRWPGPPQAPHPRWSTSPIGEAASSAARKINRNSYSRRSDGLLQTGLYVALRVLARLRGANWRMLNPSSIPPPLIVVSQVISSSTGAIIDAILRVTGNISTECSQSLLDSPRVRLPVDQAPRSTVGRVNEQFAQTGAI